MAELTLRLADAKSLAALFARDLSKGRAFVPEAGGVAALEPCELTLEVGTRRHRLRAEVVFVKEEGVGRGVGLQLAALDASALAALEAFVRGAEAPEDGEDAGRDDDDAREGATAVGLHARVRGLSHAEQQRLAMGGALAERVALERAYGSSVWEALLGNPRLTTPEVARIAKKGTLPRPLLEDIAGHPAWLAAGEVQRALLSNPRSSPAVVTRVLQAMSRADLLLVPQQTSYPAGVRAAAKRALGK